MSVRRYRLANQPFRRRIPEVFGHTSDDIISTFHEASWLAGPVGLLRARAAQRGLAIIFDVPRAGAIIKHHLTSPNDVRSLWRLPDGVCGLCLARFDDNLRDHERCLWCSDNTICRACHISVHISRDDGRVQACFDPGVWGSDYAYLKMKYPFPESPEGVGYIVVQGCVSCVREDVKLDTAYVSRVRRSNSFALDWKFAGPTGQWRAKISGNWLTVVLVRARVAAPGGPRTENTLGAAWATPL